MKKVLLDTSFILYALRSKIDFLEGIKFMGMTPLLPKQVLSELKSIAQSKKKLHFKNEAKIALKLLQKKKMKKVNLKSEYVDKGIISYAKKHKNVVVATMDSELKKKIKNPKLVVRGKKRLMVV